MAKANEAKLYKLLKRTIESLSLPIIIIFSLRLPQNKEILKPGLIGTSILLVEICIVSISEVKSYTTDTLFSQQVDLITQLIASGRTPDELRTDIGGDINNVKQVIEQIEGQVETTSTKGDAIQVINQMASKIILEHKGIIATS